MNRLQTQQESPPITDNPTRCLQKHHRVYLRTVRP